MTSSPHAELAAAVAAAAVRPDNKILLSAIRQHPDLEDSEFAAVREGYREGQRRVVDGAGRIVADDHETWLRDQVRRDGGDFVRTWERIKDLGLLVTRTDLRRLVFCCDRGGPQDNLTQIEVWEATEVVDRALLESRRWGQPQDEEQLIGSHDSTAPVEPRAIAGPSYRLRSVVDLAAFNAEAERVFAQRQSKHAARIMEVTNKSTGETKVGRLVDLYPDGFHLKWKGRRLFEDWTESSAGRSGARIGRHWFFDTTDYTAASGEREMALIPQWTYGKKLAAIDKTRLNDYELFGRLEKFDRRVGAPFGWYFYMLHGNRLRDWVGRRVLNAAEQGLIVLAEHDYQVLRRWGEEPYGF